MLGMWYEPLLLFKIVQVYAKGFQPLGIYWHNTLSLLKCGMHSFNGIKIDALQSSRDQFRSRVLNDSMPYDINEKITHQIGQKSGKKKQSCTSLGRISQVSYTTLTQFGKVKFQLLIAGVSPSTCPASGPGLLQSVLPPPHSPVIATQKSSRMPGS